MFVVDANMGATKSSNLTAKTISDQVTLDTTGAALHQTTLTYAWTLPGHNYGNSLDREYVRVYIPPNAVVTSQTGWNPRGSGQEHGRKFVAGFFTLVQGQSITISLVWSVPNAAAHDQSGWHYHYLVQRQAGALRSLQVHVTVPACALAPLTWTGFPMTGKGQARLIQTFIEDQQLGVSYTC
jgi:hypothetical protein